MASPANPITSADVIAILGARFVALGAKIVASSRPCKLAGHFTARRLILAFLFARFTGF